MKSDGRAVGIFDSGLGGLTILKKVRAMLPREDIIYFGDTAHVPYGSKSRETVKEFSVNIARFLENSKVKLILIACNTASALALEDVKKSVAVPVLGVIGPGARAAARASKNKNIAILATEATVNSKAYVKEIRKLDKKIKVTQRCAPLLAPAIEEGITKGPLLDLIVRCYLKTLNPVKADTLILGCTHYPIIKKRIAKIFGGGIKLIDSAEEIAKEAKALLKKEGKLKIAGKGKTLIYASDSPARFAKLAINIIGGKRPKVREIKL